MCDEMNQSFCGRIANFVVVLPVYAAALAGFNRILSTQTQQQVENALIPEKGAFKALARGGLVAATVALLVYGLNLLLQFSRWKGTAAVPAKQVALLFSGMFLTSVCEEVLYRGVLLGFTAPFMPNPWISVVGSALVFGYVHLEYSWVYGVTAFVAGLLLGAAFLKYGLYWCIGFHWLFNFTETLLNTVGKTVSKNKLFAGERKTPDDDGLTTALVEAALFFLFFSPLKLFIG